jgi:hypothetical protein
MNIWRAAGIPITASGEVFCGLRSTKISERLNKKRHRLSGKFSPSGRRLKEPMELTYSRKFYVETIFFNRIFIFFLHGRVWTFLLMMLVHC